ncbi:MAG: hypothetical protein ABSH49_35670 [Bryobacteraceae bacterium]
MTVRRRTAAEAAGALWLDVLTPCPPRRWRAAFKRDRVGLPTAPHDAERARGTDGRGGAAVLGERGGS